MPLVRRDGVDGPNQTEELITWTQMAEDLAPPEGQRLTSTLAKMLKVIAGNLHIVLRERLW